MKKEINYGKSFIFSISLLFIGIGSLTFVIVNGFLFSNQFNYFGDNYNYNNNNNDSNSEFNQSTSSPIVLIPGIGGSKLEAKLNKTSRVNYICRLQSDWFDIWLNIQLLTPKVFDCLVDNLKLHYNNRTRLNENAAGVEIRAKHFGSSKGVDYLTDSRLPFTSSYETIIKNIEINNKLKRDYDIIGASYDFRRAPNELGEYFENLKLLIENYYLKHNNNKITIICHSFGCMNSLYFLNNNSEYWKNFYIKRLISINSPWAGSFKSLKSIFYGNNFGIFLLNNENTSKLQATFPAVLFLLPTLDDNRILIETKSVNYTMKNLDLLLKMKKFNDQIEIIQDTRKILKNLKAPNVELWCLYGIGLNTTSKLIYDDDNIDGKYIETFVDGDGTVELESLEYCKKFSIQQKKPIYIKTFPGQSHQAIMNSLELSEFISSNIIANDLNNSSSSSSSKSNNNNEMEQYLYVNY